MATILAVILKNKVDEDAPGIVPILHCKNRIKIRCRVGVVGEHTHTNTQESQKSPEFTPHGLRQAMNGCVGTNHTHNRQRVTPT